MSGDLVPASEFGPEPLSPISFLHRAEHAFADRTAVVDGSRQLTYGVLGHRCRQLAGAIREAGVAPGERVSVLAPNTGTALESHFGVPMAGAVLNALNTRLSVNELAYIVDHAGSRMLIVDHEHRELAMEVSSRIDHDLTTIVAGGVDDEYEHWLAAAAPMELAVDDERQLVSLNYTSGTTGRPKGVMYAHRGAFLQALAMVSHARLDTSTVFLWTLPMFHCNGWCFPWAVTAVGGVHITLRRVEPGPVWQAVHEQHVTHLNAAPTVLSALVDHPGARPVANTLHVATGGAPPSPTLLARLADLNIDVTHLYGLTETYGPAVVCDWRDEWNRLDPAGRAVHKARQGIANIAGGDVRVVAPDGSDLPRDGRSAGEVVLRGNVVMVGYFRDPEATAAVTVRRPDGAWFKTGDIGVIHPDGYLELRDRSKDVIISGGENIASIEVEQALASHPDVLECAVVAAADDFWGEVPVAVVVTRSGTSPTEEQLIDHVKQRLARFKAPKRVIFDELPKTATGKIQKFLLRARVDEILHGPPQ